MEIFLPTSIYCFATVFVTRSLELLPTLGLLPSLRRGLRQRNSVRVGLLVLGLLPIHLQADGAVPGRNAALDELPVAPAVSLQALAAHIEQALILPVVDDTPGAAVAVVVEGQVILQKSYGFRRLGEPDEINTQTLFRLASLSKTFASAAAAIMINEAPITWETPVQQSLQDLNFKRSDYGARINLHHLLSQSSGLIPHAYTNMIEDHASYKQIIDRLDRVDFVCAPGTCYGYQNVAFSLVGDVVAANVGTDYPSYVTKRIFSPLGMKRASFGEDAFVNDNNHASPHVRDGENWASTGTTGHYYKVPPAAGVNASIEDMTQWLLAQLGDNPVVLSPQMLDMMQSKVVQTTRQQAHYRRRRGLTNTGYGLGWRVFDYAGDLGNVHHGGYVRGMRSEMVFNRKHQTGLVFLTNSEPGVINDMVFDFLDIYRDYRGDRDRAALRMAARVKAGALSNQASPAIEPSAQHPSSSMAPIGGS